MQINALIKLIYAEIIAKTGVEHVYDSLNKPLFEFLLVINIPAISLANKVSI